ncbi:hypothetical protein DI09_196p10 [Mitosporidium daphniae]|uniref:Translation machinery-associated protein 22 n=1 Tax=Mitosporidium daphniae TaxID=1485682 RepID=A0A098VTG2_9MICR|nr:uncharacterized protein DI09_196p10 [Mitosporidium daphniae]KGG52267.1 hypothetical protein DI09_196p10 [Mitosporidium daphniae]|eukprot:XP_013238703.1 uncharacterized protein DI09_196p10 [Mitosporidium daphniae]
MPKRKQNQLQVPVEGGISSSSEEVLAPAPFDIEKQTKKEAQKIEKERKRLENLRVRIKTAKKIGNKLATHLSGVAAFGVDMKKLSKALSHRFACGCSVTKGPTGEDEIIIQGDVASETLSFLTTNPDWKDIFLASQIEIKSK